jgi:hypothetical protein
MPIKRVNYYDHEFLHAADFIAEQDYHRGMRYRHNRLLHTPGIADGLDVTFQSGSTKVTIGSGTAVDDLGQEIVIPDGETRTYELSSAKAASGQTNVVYLMIAYADKPDDPTTETDGAGNTRVSEDPLITHLANPPQNPTRRLVLAKVTMSDTAVQSVDKTTRLTAGAVAGDLAVSSLRLKAPNVDSSKWVVVAGTGVNQASLTGSLSIAKSGVQSTDGNLTVDGRLGLGIASPVNRLDVLGQGVFRSAPWLGPASGAAALLAGFDPANSGGTGILLAHNNAGVSTRLWLEGEPIIFAARGAVKGVLDGAGNLGLGVATPGRRLHVEGSEIHSGGQDAGFSFSNRGTTGISGDLGERWVWYAMQKVARLWTPGSGDLLGVTADGKLGIGTVTPQQRLDLVGGTLSIRRSWGNFLELWKTDSSPNKVWVFHTSDPARPILFIGYSADALANIDWKYWLDPDANVARLNNAAVGQMGHGAVWAGFSHGDQVGQPSYGLLQSNVGKNTLVNKRAGGGNIEFRVDNATKLAMADGGQLAVDAGATNNATIDLAQGAAAAGLVFGGHGSGEGIASKRTGGGNQFGLDIYTAFARRVWIQQNGVVFSTSGWNGPSDRVLKKNVKTLGGALDGVRQLDGVRFEWKKTTTEAAGLGADDLVAVGGQIGLLGDQVEKQFPELVSQWEGDDGKSYRAVDYGRLSAVLTEAVKELADQVDGLAARVARLEGKSASKG